MQHFNSFVLARALHVVGVVLWIGGVAFVTTVLISTLSLMAVLSAVAGSHGFRF